MNGESKCTIGNYQWPHCVFVKHIYYTSDRWWSARVRLVHSWAACDTHLYVWHSCDTRLYVWHSCDTHVYVWHSCDTHVYVWHSCHTHLYVWHSCDTHTYVWHSCDTHLYVWHSCDTHLYQPIIYLHIFSIYQIRVTHTYLSVTHINECHPFIMMNGESDRY